MSLKHLRPLGGVWDMNRSFGLLVLFALFAFISMAEAAADVPSMAEFIRANQQPNGAFDPYSSPQTAMGILALHSYEGNSQTVIDALGWAKQDLESNDSYSWAEADIPGLNLYAYSIAGDINQIDLGAITGRLLAMQGNGGGFKGYSQCIENCTESDWTLQVWAAGEDSISTSAALLGLVGIGGIDEGMKTSALNSLLSLRNSDGSFNLTNTTTIGTFWSLGPDMYSQTAFVILGMEAAGASENEISSSLDFLRDGAASRFGGNQSIFAAALSSLAFAAYGDTDYSILSLENIKCSQNPDGGYGDASRMAGGSNVLDTAAALLAAVNSTANLACPENIPSPTPTQTPSPSPSITSSPSPSPEANATASPSPSPSPSTDACTENWECGEWSECSGGYETRSCIELNDCGTTQNTPEESRSCNSPSATQPVSTSGYSIDYDPSDESATPTLAASPSANPSPALSQGIAIKEEEDGSSLARQLLSAGVSNKKAATEINQTKITPIPTIQAWTALLSLREYGWAVAVFAFFLMIGLFLGYKTSEK